MFGFSKKRRRPSALLAEQMADDYFPDGKTAPELLAVAVAAYSYMALSR